MSPQGGTRTTALIRTIPDMQLMVTPRATMLEVTSARATVAVRVAVCVVAERGGVRLVAVRAAADLGRANLREE